MLLKYKNPVVFFFKNSIRGITLFSTPKNVKKYVDFHMPKIWQVMKHIDNSVHQAYKVQ